MLILKPLSGTLSYWTIPHDAKLTSLLKLSPPWSLRRPASQCFLYLLIVFFSLFFLSSSTSFLESKFSPMFYTLFSYPPAFTLFLGNVTSLATTDIWRTLSQIWILSGVSKWNARILLCAAVDPCSEFHEASGDRHSPTFLSLAPSTVPATYGIAYVHA